MDQLWEFRDVLSEENCSWERVNNGSLNGNGDFSDRDFSIR